MQLTVTRVACLMLLYAAAASQDVVFAQALVISPGAQPAAPASTPAVSLPGVQITPVAPTIQIAPGIQVTPGMTVAPGSTVTRQGSVQPGALGQPMPTTAQPVTDGKEPSRSDVPGAPAPAQAQPGLPSPAQAQPALPAPVTELTFVVATDINPDVTGRASPLVVRMYELKSLNAFSNADFFAMFDQENQTIGTDLVSRDEWAITPGKNQQVLKPLQKETRYVGIIAAFREIEQAKWRASTLVVPDQPRRLEIHVGRNGIDVK